MGQCCDCLKPKPQPPQEDVMQTQNCTQEALNQTEYQTETITISHPTQKEEFHKLNISDFRLVKTLGRGSFGKVLMVRKKDSKSIYAMKIISKGDLNKKKQEVYAKTERTILERSRHPFMVRLYYAFQTPQKLYYVMDFCQGGELFFHLRRAYKFKEEAVIFYAAELVLALDYMHQEGIIYRDLKPENILLCDDGHIKLTDFGLSKWIPDRNRMAHSIVGTPEYLAPEIYQDGSHDESCDWWSLGSLMYEMLTGAAPYYSQDRTLMFRNRAEKPIDIKPWFSEACASIIVGLLNNNPRQRLNISEIRSHKFFEKIDWDEVYQRKLKPPIVPELQNEMDLKYFNKMYVEEPAQDSPVSKLEQYEHYDQFSYEEQ